jgi:beta-glucosidase
VRTETAYSIAKRRVRAGADAAAEARALVGEMTIEEKLGCLDGDTEFWSGLVDMVSGGYYRNPFPGASVPRLGFPGVRFCDGPRGVVVGPSTCFPVAMARGATFDPALEERVGDAIGIEARAQRVNLFGGVCVNLLRHPGWGRAQETYGEDPHHVGEMGAALTRGVQRHVMACVKHFACNSIENARFKVDVAVAPDVLDEVYLPHFRRVVDEGVAVVMSAYNSLNGVWCGDNRVLLTQILREDWGFAGFTISDWVYGLRDPVGSVGAGLDLEMPFRQQRARTLPAAVADGTLALVDVERAAENIVRTVLRFDAATPDERPDPARLACDAHRALAREVAEQSIVLLKNDAIDGAPLLPLARSARMRIAVVGLLADVPNLGDGGSSDVHPPHVVTPNEGLRAVFTAADWVDDPAAADVAIVVVGYTKEDEGEFTGAFDASLLALMPPAPHEGVWSELAAAAESGRGMALGGDRRSLQLRRDDEALIARVAAVQRRTVVLVMAGSAVIVEPWIESVAAVLHVWYPGMEGGTAIANVLAGAVNPSGRLPFVVPLDESHLPAFDPDASAVTYDRWHGQWMLDRDGRRPRYPFGFGLSYTTFALASARRDAGVVRVEVVNCGARDGATVVFVFRPEGPTKRLVGFQKLRVSAGARATAQIPAGLAGPLLVARHASDPDTIRVP